jgi:hypothetical protein
MTSIQRKVYEVLCWMDTQGLKPRRPTSADSYLNSFTLQVEKWNRLMPHQRRGALWIPNLKGLRKLGLGVDVRHDGDHAVAVCGKHQVIALGDSEALILLLSEFKGGCPNDA